MPSATSAVIAACTLRSGTSSASATSLASFVDELCPTRKFSPRTMKCHREHVTVQLRNVFEAVHGVEQRRVAHAPLAGKGQGAQVRLGTRLPAGARRRTSAQQTATGSEESPSSPWALGHDERQHAVAGMAGREAAKTLWDHRIASFSEVARHRRLPVGDRIEQRVHDVHVFGKRRETAHAVARSEARGLVASAIPGPRGCQQVPEYALHAAGLS